MKKKRLIAFYFALVACSATIPFLIGIEDPKDSIPDFISAASVMAASFYAFRYFDPYDLRKKHLDRQCEQVLKLLEAINGYKALIEIKGTETDDGTYFFYATRSRIKDILHKDFGLGKFRTHTLKIDIEMYLSLCNELDAIKRNIWLPKKISNKLYFLDPNHSFYDPKLDCETSVIMHKHCNGVKSETQHNYINETELTLQGLASEFLEIINACEKWLNKNSFSSKFLNL